MKQYNIRAQFPRSRSINSIIRQRILERDLFECAYCHFPADSVDHIIPWSYGGTDNDDNLVASCDICNKIASGKVFDSFQLKRDHIRDRYGKYLEGRFRRWRKKMSFCPDCQSVFIPQVDGASNVLCGSCYAESQEPVYDRAVMRRMVREANKQIKEEKVRYSLD